MTTAAPRVLIFDTDPGRGASSVDSLSKSALGSVLGSLATFAELHGSDYGPSPCVLELQSGLADILVVVEHGATAGALNHLSDIARRQDVTTLLLVEQVGEPSDLVKRVQNYDAWMNLHAPAEELTGRVATLLDRAEKKAKGRSKLATVDSRFLAVAIHDLRTPLNVIGLTIRAIIQTVPQRNAALDEDLTFLQDNSLQLKDMLELLSDFCKLMDGEAKVSTTAQFDPRRFLSDLLEDRRERPGVDSTPLRLEVAASSPTDVTLDAARVRLALKHALENTIIAAGQKPVLVRSSGDEDRWVIELIAETPPPKLLMSMPLRADVFERLTGSPGERRGLDLAIAARISELLGGEARLKIEPDRQSTIVLDWPRRSTLT